MATIRPVYGSPVTHTCTLASLASDTNLIAGRQGTAIDNSAATLIDALVGGKVTTGTSPTAGRVIEIWAFGSYDGTTYSAGAGASDANFSPTGEKAQMRLLAVIDTDGTSNHAYEWGPISVAAAFGGIMPAEWGVFAVHNTGVNLNSTGGNHEIKHTPVTIDAT
ncbi:MAG: hypothetical protein KAX84_03895 [Burkholderiales bacterium]|nr:hypothetical protein [Burkholderiales bacterium]